MSEFKVVLESSVNMEKWSEIEPVLKEYAGLLQTEMWVMNLHNKMAEAKTEDGKLFVRFWPSFGSRIKLSEAFGIRLTDGQTDGTPPCGGEGMITMVDPATGEVLAEVFEGTLFVLFDLPHGLNSGKIMRAIMEQYVLLQKSPEEQVRLVAEQAEARRKASREAYIKECARRIDKTIAETEKTFAVKSKEVPELLQKYIRAQRELAGLERKLVQLKTANYEELEKIGMEYDRLVSIPKVTRVDIADGVVKVYTTTLFCIDDRDGIVHEIGRFRIDIYTNGSNDGVCWNNLTRQVGGMNAPHVNSEGKACLGTSATGFAEFLAVQEYALVAMYAINFVESANTADSWGKGIQNWPVAKPAEEAK